MTWMKYKEVKMKKILFATGNPTKAKRFSKGLRRTDFNSY